jgi:hypothetical protein
MAATVRWSVVVVFVPGEVIARCPFGTLKIISLTLTAHHLDSVLLVVRLFYVLNRSASVPVLGSLGYESRRHAPPCPEAGGCSQVRPGAAKWPFVSSLWSDWSAGGVGQPGLLPRNAQMSRQEEGY